MFSWNDLVLTVNHELCMLKSNGINTILRANCSSKFDLLVLGEEENLREFETPCDRSPCINYSQGLPFESNNAQSLQLVKNVCIDCKFECLVQAGKKIGCLCRKRKSFTEEYCLTDAGILKIKLYRPALFEAATYKLNDFCAIKGSEELKNRICLSLIACTDTSSLGSTRKLLFLNFLRTLLNFHGYHVTTSSIYPEYGDDDPLKLHNSARNLLTVTHDLGTASSKSEVKAKIFNFVGNCAERCCEEETLQMVFLQSDSCSHWIERSWADANVKNVQKISFLVGNVTDMMSFQQYFELSKSQIFSTTKLKYGEEAVSGSSWKEKIHKLCCGAIKLELLMKNHSSLIKVDSGVDRLNSKGIFILYNYSRICHILENYEMAVQQGCYPKLPHLEDVDWVVLSGEEEWYLLFNFVIVYPEILMQACKFDENACVVQINPHKITAFIYQLCRMFSKFYNKVQVLAEGLNHLLPIIAARVHFVQTLKKILDHAFFILEVEPVLSI